MKTMTGLSKLHEFLNIFIQQATKKGTHHICSTVLEILLELSHNLAFPNCCVFLFFKQDTLSDEVCYSCFTVFLIISSTFLNAFLFLSSKIPSLAPPLHLK
jgi:hypothetical protein